MVYQFSGHNNHHQIQQEQEEISHRTMNNPFLFRNQSSNQQTNTSAGYLPGSNMVGHHNFYQHQPATLSSSLLSLSSSDDESSNDFINTNSTFHHHPSTDSLYSCDEVNSEFMDENKILELNGITVDQGVPSSASFPPNSGSTNLGNNFQHVAQVSNSANITSQPMSSMNVNGFNQQQQFMMPQMKQKVKKAILYIDLDNFPISKPAEYLEMLARIKSKYFIDVTAKKIFGDLNQFEKLPVDFQFSHQLIICPKVSSRKNTTDIALTIEVIKDLERKKPFDVFIIASSDSDFVPVVKAIRDEGKECWILPSHNYPHQTLMSICNGVLDFNSVSNPLRDLNIPTSKSSTSLDATTKTSPTTSPRKKELPKVHITTNHIPPSQNKLSITEVKSLITKIIRKLEYSNVPTFNLSFIHEQLRDKSVLYSHYGYTNFRALFEEWRQENPKFKFDRNEKNGQLSFVQEVHPTILHRPPPPPTTIPTSSPNLSYSNVKVMSRERVSNNVASTSSSESPELTKPRGNRKILKKAITNILKGLYENNPKGSFNMSFVNERMREKGLRYKEHGYDSMKTLFSEWKEEHPTATLSVNLKSGELYFTPSFSL